MPGPGVRQPRTRASRTPRSRARFLDMAPTDEQSTYFRKGFGLKADVQGDLSADYNGRIVDALREHDYALTVEDVTIRLAREFGFCYGVERAVEYAYQTRRKFPERRLLLVGEIIHNPHVNAKLRSMGIEILVPDAEGTFDFSTVGAEDVVILPAFGVTMAAFEALRATGCVLVDTTCGSVLNVWKRVEAYARDGFTALIHGKHYHEETRATASQVLKYPGGSYLVVRDMSEAREVCDYIEGRGRPRCLPRQIPEGSVARLRSGRAPPPRRRGEPDDDAGQGIAGDRRGGRERDPACARRGGARARLPHLRHDLQRHAGAAGRGDRAARGAAHGDDRHRRVQLQQHDLTRRALRRARADVPHRGCDGDRSRAGTVHFRRAGVKHVEATESAWLPVEGPVRIGVTAGASTPNNKIGETVARILATRGLVLQTV